MIGAVQGSCTNHHIKEDIVTSLNRRQFVAGGAMASALAAVGVSGAASALADEASWNKEADVVIVGCGGGGLAASVLLSEAGKSVVLVEVGSDQHAGNTSLCAGMIQGCCTKAQAEAGIEDSVEEYVKLLDACAEGYGDPELRRLFAENCGPTVDWLGEQGVVFPPENISTSGTVVDYYTDVTPAVPRRHVVASYSGAEIVDVLYNKAVENGAEFLFSTEATRLVVEDGRVVGIEAVDADGAPLRIGAADAVLMNAGGFSRNIDMVNTFMTPSLAGMVSDRPVLASYGSLYQKGTGILMCMAVGAGLSTPWVAYNAAPGIAANPAMNQGGFIGTPGIFVSTDGKRHINEDRTIGSSEQAVTEIWKQDQGLVWAIWDQTGVDGAPVHYISPDFSNEVEEGYIFKADTIEELAEAIGLDPEVLAQTVADYNDAMANGTDELGRTNGQPIQDAPFYAGRVIAVSPDTAGGVTVNTKLQVTNVFGEPIPGLYAVGNMTGGFKGRVNVGCGQAIGWSYTAGRLAAADILANG